MNLFDLMAKITLDTSGYDKGVGEATKAGEELANKFGNGVKKVAKFGAALATGATAAVGVLAKIGTNYNSQMEQYTTNFKVMLGSTEEATKKVEELKEMAAKTPFGMSDLAEATQTLLSFQVPAEKTNNILKMLGDVSLGNKEKMKGLALVFGQVTSAGRLQGQDLMQLINQGFNPLNYISERTGESMEELRDRMSKGGISAEELTQAFADATAEGGQFYNGMEEASQTAEGLKSTLEDVVKTKIGEFFSGLSEKIKKALPNVISFVENIDVSKVEATVSKLLNTFVSLTPIIAAATAASLAYKAAVSISKIIDAVKAATEGQTIAQVALNAVMNANPFVLVATLIAGVTTALVTLFATNENFRNKVIAVWDNVTSFISKCVGVLKTFFSETLPNAISTVVSWISRLPEKFREVANTVIDVFKALPHKMLEVGKNIIQGLIDGIGSMGSALWDAAKNIANKALDSIKSFFGIHSPSRLMRDQVGKFIPAGIAVGIEANTDDVKSAMKSVGEDALTQARSITDELSNLSANDYAYSIGGGANRLTNDTATAYNSGNRGVSVVQNIYSEAKTAADLMQEAQYQQERAVMMGV